MLQELTSIKDWQGANTHHIQQQAIQSLEQGEVVWLPNLSFTINKNELNLLSENFCSKNTKNISFNSKNNQLGGAVVKDLQTEELLKNMMGRFANYSLSLIQNLLPHYTSQLQVGRTSYRPVEIKGRIPKSFRKDDTRLHVDAFPSSPTQGRRIFRIFTNINIHNQPRIWNLGEPFETVIEKFSHRLTNPFFGSAALLKLCKVTRSLRTPYDHMMLKLHDGMKANLNYQNTVKKFNFHFPANSTWLVFTDKASHAALSGQYALEQTFYLPADAMQNTTQSPLKILEKFLNKRLI